MLNKEHNTPPYGPRYQPLHAWTRWRTRRRDRLPACLKGKQALCSSGSCADEVKLLINAVCLNSGHQRRRAERGSGHPAWTRSDEQAAQDA